MGDESDGQGGPRSNRRRDQLPMPSPAGLRRVDAAAFVGLSPTHFDRAVHEGAMPQPRNICGVNVWSVRKLAEALDPDAGPPSNPWDA